MKELNSAMHLLKVYVASETSDEDNKKLWTFTLNDWTSNA